ncbi:MAG: PspA/IM30 family protein [Bdellovibrionales bacterium]|nr:PspA/IM30 family protein [Bdellovibrionales bacterium]
MAENLAGRVGRIISGGFNALVDAVENLSPEMVMEQAIREIDDAIDDVRAELGREAAHKHLASKRIMEENGKHEELSERIEVALAEGREELAEAAIARQLDIEAQIPVLEQSLTERAAREKELEGFVQALQAKRRQMREELDGFRQARREAAGLEHSNGSSAQRSGATVSSKVTKAESAFHRVLQAQTGLPSGAAQTDARNLAQLAELEDLARTNRIKERLAQAKQKLETNG